MKKSCAFTGHRTLPDDFDEKKLKKTIEILLQSGCDRFYCGMALGFDLLCCQILFSLRSYYTFSVVACIPCADQDKSFTVAERTLYRDLCARCDETVVISDSYHSGCMFERNRYMVDRADIVLAYLTQKKSGTGYTVRYAEKNKKQVIFV